jgi:hypothetical protein
MQNLDDAMIRGLLMVGADQPEIASDIYYECFV